MLRATTACTFSRSNRHRIVQKWSEPQVLGTFFLRNALRATAACNFSTSELPKVVRTSGVLYIFTSTCTSRHNSVHIFDLRTPKSGSDLRCFVHFTSTCASRHNGVHFLDSSTSKSRPNMVCFVHFYFHMCFAPQRRALFQHLNFQKSSEPDVF